MVFQDQMGYWEYLICYYLNPSIVLKYSALHNIAKAETGSMCSTVDGCIILVTVAFYCSFAT